MAATFIPQHRRRDEDHTEQGIDILDWTINATSKSIGMASELDTLQTELGLTLPEMTFPNNQLVLLHKPTGWTYSLNCKDALSMVKNAKLGPGDGAVKVGYADAWLKSRTDPSTNQPLQDTSPTKPYDWTYTTTYHGSDGSPSQFKPADSENRLHAIPIAELTRRDPILFYAETPLFEDELHDNGTSFLTVRIRVMPTCFFILSRWMLRVDNVLFRVYDTRIYHSFASSPPLVIRETSGWEAPYTTVKKSLPVPDDLSPLTDHAFVHRVLSSLPVLESQNKGANTGWQGMGTAIEVATMR